MRRLNNGIDCCPSLEFSTSPSWETSIGTDLSFDQLSFGSLPSLLRLEPVFDTSVSQSFNILGQDNQGSSTEFNVSATPMLTTLSLPASLSTMLDDNCNSPEDHHLQRDDSLTSSLSSCPPNLTLTGMADFRVLEFPSPPLTLSPFITAPPPESPIIDYINADSSTIQYASAVVTSAWGPDISVHPDYPIVDVPPPGLSTLSSPPAFEHDFGPEHFPESRDRSTTLSTVAKFKNLGRKLKRLFSFISSGKTEQSNRSPDKISADPRPATPVTDIDHDSSKVEATTQSDDSIVKVEENINSLSSTEFPELGPRRPIKTLNNLHELPDDCIAPDNTKEYPRSIGRTLEIEARPKTLAEIKSKRRLTFSSSTHAGSQSSSSVVAIARTRQRPQSSIILPVSKSNPGL
ncbi:hypothetical protein H0H93_012508 [Arthromyces matolae]|nr:hypothetical protein H0H93_012508 [Arthromyces matolae]